MPKGYQKNKTLQLRSESMGRTVPVTALPRVLKDRAIGSVQTLCFPV